MYPLSEAHQRVLADDDDTGSTLIAELKTFSGTRYLSLSDYTVKYDGGNTYTTIQNLTLENTNPDEGLGTQEWELIADLEKKGWFVDEHNNWRTLDASVVISLALFDKQTEDYLEPLIMFQGIGGRNSSNDDAAIVIPFKDLDGITAEERVRYLSKEDQRIIDPEDSSLDNISKRPPQESGALG